MPVTKETTFTPFPVDQKEMTISFLPSSRPSIVCSFPLFSAFFSSRLEAKGRDEMMNTPLHVDGTENASELFLFFLKLKKKKSAASTRLSLLNTSKGD